MTNSNRTNYHHGGANATERMIIHLLTKTPAKQPDPKTANRSQSAPRR